MHDIHVYICPVCNLPVAVEDYLKQRIEKLDPDAIIYKEVKVVEHHCAGAKATPYYTVLHYDCHKKVTEALTALLGRHVYSSPDIYVEYFEQERISLIATNIATMRNLLSDTPLVFISKIARIPDEDKYQKAEKKPLHEYAKKYPQILGAVRQLGYDPEKVELQVKEDPQDLPTLIHLVALTKLGTILVKIPLWVVLQHLPKQEASERPEKRATTILIA